MQGIPRKTTPKPGRKAPFSGSKPEKPPKQPKNTENVSETFTSGFINHLLRHQNPSLLKLFSSDSSTFFRTNDRVGMIGVLGGDST
jgi:hypothetical protein